MTTMPMTISPRRRIRGGDTPPPDVSSAAPSQEIDVTPRVLIRLPAIKAVAAAVSTKTAAAKSAQPSAAATVAATPWYARLNAQLSARLNTPRVKAYLPYATAIVIAFAMFVWLRGHSGKSLPPTANSEAPAWNNGVASNWNAPVAPASNGARPATLASTSGRSPSAYQMPPSLPPSAAPNVGWHGSGSPPSGAVGSPAGTPGDLVPPMPARSPTWNNPASDPGVVRSGSVGPEYRTARATDPAAVATGGGPNNSNEAGVARFQGMITHPQ